MSRLTEFFSILVRPNSTAWLKPNDAYLNNLKKWKPLDGDLEKRN